MNPDKRHTFNSNNCRTSGIASFHYLPSFCGGGGFIYIMNECIFQ